MASRSAAMAFASLGRATCLRGGAQQPLRFASASAAAATPSHSGALTIGTRARFFATDAPPTTSSGRPAFNTPSPTPASTTAGVPSSNSSVPAPGSTGGSPSGISGSQTGTTITPATSRASSPPPPLPPASSPPPPPSSHLPPKKKRKGLFRRLGQILGYGTVALLGSGGYYVYMANHPPPQLPYDATKKNLVILGSGWGATALLDAIDTTEYNVIIISPFNYFLFTPLLPSVTTGTLNGHSITQPTRHLARYKSREVQVVEAEATKVDSANKTVTFVDRSDIYGNLGTVEIPYDYLVYSVGSENQTFGIEGVKKNALFLKELGDAEAIRRRLLECVEKASIIGQSEAEIDRLLHFVIVGGGPTGVEASGEFRDFVRDDLSKWYPAVSGRVRVTLIEALPNILPSFNMRLVEFTEHVFKEDDIEILTKHMVKDADASSVTVQNPNGDLVRIPTGMLVWAAGNTARPLTRDLQGQLKDVQTNRRGLLVDDCLRLKGAEDSIFAIGDAAATDCPPTAQVANQQGHYLAGVLEGLARIERIKKKLVLTREQPESSERQAELHRLERKLERTEAGLKPFQYTNRGAMAYIGNDRGIAEFAHGDSSVSTGGWLTGVLWSSAYWSMLFGLRSRTSVALDWIKIRLFGRDLTM